MVWCADNKDIAAIVHLAAQAGVRHSLVDPYCLCSVERDGPSGGAGGGAPAAAAAAPGLCQLLVGLRRQHGPAVPRDGPGGHADLGLCGDQAGRRTDEPCLCASARPAADRVCASSPSMARGGGRTWRITASPGRSSAGEPITVYDGGALRRDFTYIDDIVAGVIGCLDRPPDGELPARVLNIGNHRSEPVSTLVALLEQALGRRAIVRDGAAAGGRCGGDVRLGRRDCGADRFRAADVAGRGDSAVRGLVPGVGRDRRIKPAESALDRRRRVAYIAAPAAPDGAICLLPSWCG